VKIIEIILAIIAGYCLVEWLLCHAAVSRGRIGDGRVFVEARWLGLCGILALGFLGLLLK
jgi:hypothetical protein